MSLKNLQIRRFFVFYRRFYIFAVVNQRFNEHINRIRVRAVGTIPAARFATRQRETTSEKRIAET